MKRKRKSRKVYMTAIDTTEISTILKDAGFSNRGMAAIVNDELSEEDAYRKWKYWISHGRMPKHKLEKMNGIIRRVASENETA